MTSSLVPSAPPFANWGWIGKPSPRPELTRRAEDRNRETARLYDKLGLAEYEAIEGFVRWKELDGN